MGDPDIPNGLDLCLHLHRFCGLALLLREGMFLALWSRPSQCKLIYSCVFNWQPDWNKRTKETMRFSQSAQERISVEAYYYHCLTALLTIVLLLVILVFVSIQLMDTAQSFL